MWPNLSSAVLAVFCEVTVGYVDADIRARQLGGCAVRLPTRHGDAPRMRNRPVLSHVLLSNPVSRNFSNHSSPSLSKLFLATANCLCSANLFRRVSAKRNCQPREVAATVRRRANSF